MPETIYPDLPSTVKIGDHILDRAHTDAVLAATLPQLPPDATLGVGFGVDMAGAKVAMMWTRQTDFGTWKLTAAGEYDWSGDKRAGLYGSLIL